MSEKPIGIVAVAGSVHVEGGMRCRINNPVLAVSATTRSCEARAGTDLFEPHVVDLQLEGALLRAGTEEDTHDVAAVTSIERVDFETVFRPFVARGKRFRCWLKAILGEEQHDGVRLPVPLDFERNPFPARKIGRRHRSLAGTENGTGPARLGPVCHRAGNHQGSFAVVGPPVGSLEVGCRLPTDQFVRRNHPPMAEFTCRLFPFKVANETLADTFRS